MNYQQILDDIERQVRAEPPEGEVADYIPELAKVDPDKFGICLQCVDGKVFSAGDADIPFSIQSMAKVLGLALALSCADEEVWARVGVEPSGDPFNSLVQLEYECGIPRNPLINPGGLVVADILLSHLSDPRADILAFARALSGAPQVRFDSAVAQSELDTAFRNRALTNLMKAFGNIRNPVDRVLDLYIHLCSLEMTCRQAARAFVFLADRGRSLAAAGVPQLTVDQIRRINALMLTCGFYDEAGDFAFEVGLPGKSGVGGGIVAICPQRFCAVTWSPRLSDKGNSERGTRALQILTSRADASIFS